MNTMVYAVPDSGNADVCRASTNDQMSCERVMIRVIGGVIGFLIGYYVMIRGDGVMGGAAQRIESNQTLLPLCSCQRSAAEPLHFHRAPLKFYRTQSVRND
jgi:hypothetical protein